MSGHKRVKDIGEFGLIAKLAKAIKTDNSVIKGIGDDAAVIKFSAHKYWLFKTDMIVQDVHFKNNMPAELIGRKALARNISDIAAMGGVPSHAVISLALPAQTKVSFIEKIYQGLIRVAKEFKINIVGGDISRSDKIIISIALLGQVKKSNLVLRSKARKGDLIFTTGRLGNSFKSGKHLFFVPRIQQALSLVRRYKPTAMIDISDGLIMDLAHILEASRVGAFIYEEFIPLNKNANLHSALYQGEDYELLFTLPGRKAAWLIRDSRKSNKKFNFYCLGEIVDKKYGLNLVDRRYRFNKIKPKGFTHF